MDTELSIKTQNESGFSILDLSGDLDAFTCEKLHNAIEDLTNGGSRKFIICMAKIKYIDSSGLGTLVGGLRRINELDGSLALCGASDQVRKVFKITGLNKVFSLFDNREDALSSIKN